MSALEDITRTLRLLDPVQDGWERAIFLGKSAERSVDAHLLLNGRRHNPDMIKGFIVRRTAEFDGWEISDIDPDGCWHDAKIAA